MSELTVMEATRQGLIEEMRRDPRVWALGEDLARGGVFGQYAAMVEEFGKQRIVSTPISEAMIMSAGLGAALAGTRPVIEMRIADFTLCAMDELVNQIAKVRYMFGGQPRSMRNARVCCSVPSCASARHAYPCPIRHRSKTSIASLQRRSPLACVRSLVAGLVVIELGINQAGW